MQLPSDGNQTTEAKAKKESPKILDNLWQKERSHKKKSCSFKHDINKKGKRDRPSSSSPEPRSQSKDSKDGKGASKGTAPKGTSPFGTPNLPSCFNFPKGKCTSHAILGLCPNVPSTKWMKVANLKNSAEFFIQITKRQARSRKKNQKSEKASDAIVRSNRKFGFCISGRRIARTRGWTYELETVHSEEERQEIS